MHELGHQLGLAHEPLGSGGVQSPIYASLMNYDYNYGFDGDVYKIQFSPGTFVKHKLNEASINETLPFPSTKLSFLTKGPYAFTIQADPASPLTSTLVDFNRNGEFDERNVSADINDGSALVIKDQDAGPLPKVSGDVALASMGHMLIGFATELPTVDVNTYHGRGATPSFSGRLNYYTMRSGGIIKSGQFPRVGMTGAMSALANSTLGKVLVAFPAGDAGLVVNAYEVRRDGTLAINDALSFRVRRKKRTWLRPPRLRSSMSFYGIGEQSSLSSMS